MKIFIVLRFHASAYFLVYFQIFSSRIALPLKEVQKSLDLGGTDVGQSPDLTVREYTAFAHTAEKTEAQRLPVNKNRKLKPDKKGVCLESH